MAVFLRRRWIRHPVQRCRDEGEAQQPDGTKAAPGNSVQHAVPI